MTKNVVAKTWEWASGATGSGGTYNSDQPFGENTITITGTGFGAGPTIAIFAKWTDGVNGEEIPLSSPDIGADFDTGNYATGFKSKYFTLGDTTGASFREGGTDASTDNRLTGFVRILSAFDTYLAAHDMGVPSGRNFSGVATANTLPSISSYKGLWLSDEALDNLTKADIVLPSWTTAAFQIAGNQAEAPITMTTDFDFDEWNSYLVYQEPGADPFVDNGITEASVTIPSQGTTTVLKTDAPTFNSSATAAQYTHVNFPAWSGNGSQDLTQHLFRYFYLATGANARARLELGNNSTYTNCTERRVVPHDSWSSTEVIATLDTLQAQNMTHWFITNASGTQQSGLIP